jgi:hypothetical protein
MAFRIDHEFLLIGKKSTGFSKNYFYEWDDGLGGTKTQLFLNIHVNSTDIPGDKVGNGIFDVMKNYFFHDLSRDAGERFEDMLKEINAEVQNQEEELGEKIVPKTHVVAAVISGNVLYLSQHGDAEAYLVRRRYVSPISEGLSDPKNQDELFQNIANGEMAAGDYVLLCSTRLLRYITKPDLGRLLSGGAELSMALEAIDDAVSIDLMDRMSILGVQVGEEEMAVIDGDEADLSEAPKVPKEKRFAGLGDSLKLKLGKLIPTKKESKPVDEEPEHEPMPEPKHEPKPKHEPMPETRPEPKPEPKHEEVLEDLDAHRDAIRAGIERGSQVPSEFAEMMNEWKDLKRDKILLSLIVVVLVLIGGIYLVRNQGQKQNFIEDLEGKLSNVELNINTSRTTGAYDKESATILLDEAEALSLEVLNSGYLRGKASEFLTEIENQRDRLDSVRRIENPEVFVDFSLTNPTMNALGIISLGDNIHVFEHDKLYEILLDQVQTPVTIDSNEVVIDAAYHDDRESLFFLTKSNRVIEYADQQFAFVDTADAAWHAATDLEIYNNRLYLLDSEEGEIWRYYPQRNGFSGGDSYVSDDTNLVDAVSLAIDGAVYVMQADGSLIKLSAGETVADFDVRKAPNTDLSGATVFNTEFEQFQAFILDPAGSRVLVYNKDSRTGDLVYSAQYVLENTEELRDLYVDKESSRIYVLGKSKVYELTF